MLVDLTPSQIHYLEYLVAHKASKPEPDFITQNQAFKRFKRSNVERWVEGGIVKTYLRPHTVEYKVSELLKAAENEQDYDVKVRF